MATTQGDAERAEARWTILVQIAEGIKGDIKAGKFVWPTRIKLPMEMAITLAGRIVAKGVMEERLLDVEIEAVDDRELSIE